MQLKHTRGAGAANQNRKDTCFPVQAGPSSSPSRPDFQRLCVMGVDLVRDV